MEQKGCVGYPLISPCSLLVCLVSFACPLCSPRARAWTRHTHARTQSEDAKMFELLGLVGKPPRFAQSKTQIREAEELAEASA